MEVVSKVNKLKSVIRKEKGLGRVVGLVSSMGALHDGHLSLVRRAIHSCDVVVVTIFVNPAYFEQGADYEKYPRNLAHDVDLLTKLDVDYVFAPSADELFSRDFETFIQVEGVSEKLCGTPSSESSRGIATVAAKFFTMAEPNYAFFGMKDAQQAVVVRTMAKDLGFPVEIRVCPVVREPDGLAMSSRNSLLSAEERVAARVVYRSLCRVAERVLEGERDVPALRQAVLDRLRTEARVRIEHVDIVDAVKLAPMDVIEGEALAAVAVRIGPARLTDNILVHAPPARALAAP